METAPVHVTVVGAGYVGLVTAAGLARLGHLVTVVDVDEERIARLRGGECPLHEPGLGMLIRQGMARGRLLVSTSRAEVLPQVDAVVVAGGTPSGPCGEADLSGVEAVVDDVARRIDRSTVLVVKSTVPVGTCARLQQRVDHTLRARGAGDLRISVASNPEFLRESSAVQDFLRPDRVVVGTEDGVALRLLERLYAPLVERGTSWVEMDTRSSELTKYAANCMLATRISFMNQLAGLCEATGADIEEIRRGVGSDERIGPSFLRAGIGFGGSCFPKDLSALRRTAADAGVPMPMIEAVIDVNEAQLRAPVRALSAALDLSVSRVAVWGLSFKPDTDDLRDSPALAVVTDLLDRGAEVVVHDPVASRQLPAAIRHRVHVEATPLLAATDADAVVHATEWAVYRSVPADELATVMRGNLVVDGRNALDRESLRAAGLRVACVGRPALDPAYSVEQEMVPQLRAEMELA